VRHCAPGARPGSIGAVTGIDVRDGLRERLEALVGRRIDVWVVAALVVVVGGAALLLWLRGSPARIAPPAEVVPAEAGVQPAPGARPLLVHVAGAVRRPGVYEFKEGARVADAIDSARGALPKADLNGLNLASPVTDGMQVLVPTRARAAPPAATSLPGATPTPAPVNINSADQLTLETIPGIGPVTATAILEYRERVGPFGSIDELIEVSGIGPATLEAMRPYVTV
jgi:competence protein ComEA